MDSQDLHDKLIVGQARIEEKVNGVNQRLDRLNGSVDKLFARAEMQERELVKHANECSSKSVIAEIQRELSTGDHPGSAKVNEHLALIEKDELSAKAAKVAEKRTSAAWRDNLKPVIWLISGAILYIILFHLDELFRFYGKKP